MRKVATPYAKKKAYERVRPELDALTSDELIAVNLDIEKAVVAIVAAMPRVNALRPRIERELPMFDIQSFDKLEDYAWALSHTQTRVNDAIDRAMLSRPKRTPAAVEKAKERRDRAFTMTLRVYRDAQRAIHYLLRHRKGRADKVIPTLDSGKGRRKRKVRGGGSKLSAEAHAPRQT